MDRFLEPFINTWPTKLQEKVTETHAVSKKPRRWGPDRRPITSPTADRRNFDVSSIPGERRTELFENRTKSSITYMGQPGENRREAD